MNPSTSTFPVKTVTVGGVSVTVNPGYFLSVRPNGGTGSYGNIWHGNRVDTFTSTDSPEILCSGWPNIAVTDSIGTVRVGTGTIRYAEAANGGTLLELSTNQIGRDYEAMQVSESYAAVQALLAAAGTGGTGQQVTTGATAVVVSQSFVNVVTVTSPGQVVQLSDAFPRTIIVNRSASYFLVKPPTGGQIGTASTNAGIRVLGYSEVEFIRLTSTSWISAVLQQAAQTYASAVTASATVITGEVALLSTSATAITNFYEYGDATTGEIPPKVRMTNTSPATKALIKFAGGFTDGTGAIGGVSIATPYEVPAGATVEFTYNPATGKVVATGNDIIRGTATLVLGATTFDSASIGAVNSARITTNSRFKRCGVSAINAGTLAVEFIPTIIAGTSIAIQGYDGAGASLATDVSTIYYEIHL